LFTRKCNRVFCGETFTPAAVGQRRCPDCLKEPKVDKAEYHRKWRASRKNCPRCHAQQFKWGCPNCDADDRRAVTLVLVSKKTEGERQMVVSPSSRLARDLKISKAEVAEGLAVRFVRHVYWTLI
jgi:predicted aconitase